MCVVRRAKGLRFEDALGADVKDTPGSQQANVLETGAEPEQDEPGEEEPEEEEDADEDKFHSLRHVMPFAREAARALDTLQAAAERGGRRRRRRGTGPGHG